MLFYQKSVFTAKVSGDKFCAFLVLDDHRRMLERAVVEGKDACGGDRQQAFEAAASPSLLHSDSTITFLSPSVLRSSVCFNYHNLILSISLLISFFDFSGFFQVLSYGDIFLFFFVNVDVRLYVRRPSCFWERAAGGEWRRGGIYCLSRAGKGLKFRV